VELRLLSDQLVLGHLALRRPGRDSWTAGPARKRVVAGIPGESARGRNGRSRPTWWAAREQGPRGRSEAHAPEGSTSGRPSGLHRI